MYLPGFLAYGQMTNIGLYRYITQIGGHVLHMSICMYVVHHMQELLCNEIMYQVSLRRPAAPPISQRYRPPRRNGRPHTPLSERLLPL